MLKKILAGMIAVTAMLSFAACSENNDDDSSKASKKDSESSAVVVEDDSSAAEVETTTTAKPEEPEPSTPAAGGDTYEEDDFSVSFDSSKWSKYDAASVDGESVKDTLGIDLGNFNTQINCLYYYTDDPTTTFNIVSTSVPGLTADMDTSELIDYFTQILGGSNDKLTVDTSEGTKVGSNNAIHLKLSVDAGTGVKLIEEQYDIFGDGKMIAVTFTATEENFDSRSSEFKSILDSIKVK